MMDGGGPESRDITEENQSVCTCLFPVGWFLFLFAIPDHTGAGSNFLGKKEGRMAQPSHFLFTVTVRFAVPQQQQCAFGNHSLPWEEQPKFYSYSCAVPASCWRCINGEEYFITAENKKKNHPTQEWPQAELLIPQGRNRGRIPFQVYLGRDWNVLVSWKPPECLRTLQASPTRDFPDKLKGSVMTNGQK